MFMYVKTLNQKKIIRESDSIKVKKINLSQFKLYGAHMHAGHEKHWPFLGLWVNRGVTDKSLFGDKLRAVRLFIFILPRGLFARPLFPSAHLGAQGHAGHGV